MYRTRESQVCYEALMNRNWNICIEVQRIASSWNDSIDWTTWWHLMLLGNFWQEFVWLIKLEYRLFTARIQESSKRSEKVCYTNVKQGSPRSNSIFNLSTEWWTKPSKNAGIYNFACAHTTHLLIKSTANMNTVVDSKSPWISAVGLEINTLNREVNMSVSFCTKYFILTL